MRTEQFQPVIKLTRSEITPLCLQIAGQIRQEILRHRVVTGTRVISERCLAEALQISRNTVHQAYLQLASEGYLSLPTIRGSCPRIALQAQDNYRQPYPTINLILPERMMNFISLMRRRGLELAAGLMDRAADLGISIKVCPLPPDDSSPAAISLWMQSFLPRSLGIITLGSPVRTNAGFEMLLRQKEVPHVFVSGSNSFPHISSVTVNLKPGVRKMLRHLQKCGHRRLLLVDYVFPNDAVFNNCARERSSVISSLAGEYALETRNIFVRSNDRNFDELALSIRNDSWQPTAVWFHNDSLGDELLPRLANAGVNLFADLSVVGYDDCSLRYDLSSLNHSRLAMASMAVDFIDSLFKNGRPGEAMHGQVCCDYFPKSSVVINKP